MKERQQIFSDAKKVIDLRKNKNDRKHWQLRDEIENNNPRIKELSIKMAACGARLGKLAFTGKKDSAEYISLQKEIEQIESEQKAVLVAAGYTENDLEADYFCKKCNDTGCVPDEDGNMVSCDCIKDVYNELLLKESGLPYKAGWDGFDISVYSEPDKEKALKLFDVAKGAVSDFPKNSKIFILGKTGVGKTFLASMVGTELTKKGVYVAYVTLPELMRTLLYYGDDKTLQTERDSMKKIVKDAEMLIIDELGAEKLSDSKQDVFSSLIDQRLYEKEKGTIVITNNSLREIIENYGERVFSRLQTMKIINVDLTEGKDLRQKIKSV